MTVFVKMVNKNLYPHKKNHLVEYIVNRDVINELVLNKLTPHLVVLLSQSPLHLTRVVELETTHPKISELKQVLQTRFKHLDPNSEFDVSIFESHDKAESLFDWEIKMIKLRNQKDSLNVYFDRVRQWLGVIWQVLYTLNVMDHVRITHYDLHHGNIFVHPPKTSVERECLLYIVNSNSSIQLPMNMCQSYIFDFDMAFHQKSWNEMNLVSYPLNKQKVGILSQHNSRFDLFKFLQIVFEVVDRLQIPSIEQWLQRVFGFDRWIVNHPDVKDDNIEQQSQYVNDNLWVRMKCVASTDTDPYFSNVLCKLKLNSQTKEYEPCGHFDEDARNKLCPSVQKTMSSLTEFLSSPEINHILSREILESASPELSRIQARLTQQESKFEKCKTPHRMKMELFTKWRLLQKKQKRVLELIKQLPVNLTKYDSMVKKFAEFNEKAHDNYNILDYITEDHVFDTAISKSLLELSVLMDDLNQSIESGWYDMMAEPILTSLDVDACISMGWKPDSPHWSKNVYALNDHIKMDFQTNCESAILNQR
jgi:hypothetical protein